MNEQRFDVGHGCNGCLAGGLFMAVFFFAVVAIPKGWVDWSSPAVNHGFYIVGWFVPVCIGGYVAARGGGTTHWTHSLVVGVFAELCVVVRLARQDERLFDALVELSKDPATHWFPLAQFALTIPVALIGGAICQATRQSPDDGSRDDGEPESRN